MRRGLAVYWFLWGLLLSYLFPNYSEAFTLLQKWKCGPLIGENGKEIRGFSRVYLNCSIVTDRENHHAEKSCTITRTAFARPYSLEKITQFSVSENASLYTFLDEGRFAIGFSNFIYPFWHNATIFAPKGKIMCAYPDPANLVIELPGQTMPVEEGPSPGTP